MTTAKPRPIVRLEGPVFGLDGLKLSLQKLADDGLEPIDWSVIFMGMAHAKPSSGLLSVGADGRGPTMEVKVAPAFAVCYLVEACEHGEDRLACWKCARAAATDAARWEEP